MSADLLRQAAAKMRERAEAATDGVGAWTVEPRCYCEIADDAMETGGCDHRPFRFALRVPADRLRVASHEAGEIHHERHAEHIASWHPAVALFAAEAMEQHADLHDTYDCVHEPCAHADWARAYLGIDP